MWQFFQAIGIISVMSSPHWHATWKVFPNSCANKPYFQSDSQRSAFFGKLLAAIMILHFWTDSYGQTDSEDPDRSGSVQTTFVKFLNFLTTQNITFFSCVIFFWLQAELHVPVTTSLVQATSCFNYRKNSDNSDTQNIYCNHPKMWTRWL